MNSKFCKSEEVSALLDTRRITIYIYIYLGKSKEAKTEPLRLSAQ
jgi:hypothetical protein